jgi:hypothetical protein
MDPVSAALVQYGAVGILAVAGIVVSKILFNRWSEAQQQELHRMEEVTDRERERGDRLEAELSRLNGAVRDDYLHTIQRASDAMGAANRAVADALDAVRRS